MISELVLTLLKQQIKEKQNDLVNSIVSPFGSTTITSTKKELLREPNAELEEALNLSRDSLQHEKQGRNLEEEQQLQQAIHLSLRTNDIREQEVNVRELSFVGEDSENELFLETADPNIEFCLQESRQLSAKLMRPEPEEGPGVIRLRIVLPNLRIVSRRFYLTDKLNTVFLFLETVEEMDEIVKFGLRVEFSETVLGNPQQTLEELGLFYNAKLYIVPI